MLQQLSIRNFATVDSLDIEFQQGMTVLTGETGAGKSIILGALGLTLGDRADKTVVRSGSSKAEISARFDTSRIELARRWLTEHDLDEEPGNCILRRVVSSDGRSRGYINGSPVTMTNLKTLGELLIDIHGQHEHQSLLKRTTQRRLLDEFCVEARLLDQVHSTFRQWQQNFQQLDDLGNRSREDSAQQQLLAYQLQELQELQVGENEAAELDAEFKTLQHADEIIAAARQALTLCDGDDQDNAASMVNQALNALRQLPEAEPRLTAVIQLLETAEIQLSEASGELRVFTEDFEADPERLAQVSDRLGELHNLARKHRIEPRQLAEFTESLRLELDRYRDSDAELEQLKANDQLLREQFTSLAGQLSGQRAAGAERLASLVNQQLKQLGMPHAALEVKLSPLQSDKPLQDGLESVEYLVTTNPGQAAGPLVKIASGGELSRISLAIQVVTAQTSQIPSLVFDEVDVGIGGGVAKVVGRLLRELGGKTQILCVTHQAQVAGQGHHHFQVSKASADNSTLTRISELAGEEKVREVARMLGGEDFSDESLAHAQQMVASS